MGESRWGAITGVCTNRSGPAAHIVDWRRRTIMAKKLQPKAAKRLPSGKHITFDQGQAKSNDGSLPIKTALIERPEKE